MTDTTYNVMKPDKGVPVNRERIPERQPHAKGFGAFGHFEVTKDVSAYTKAAMFQPGTKTDALLQQLDLQNCLCGYIGLEDYTLFPFIRPGSFVEIDEHQDKVKPGNWQNEFDRPIYFVELRGGYACSWCELGGNQLILVPSPQSRGQIRQFRYPTEADIVGRVTAVTMRIAEVEGNQSKE